MTSTREIQKATTKYVKDNLNVVSFVLELLIISVFAFLITLFQAGFDVRKINWTVFAFTDIFNIYCRIVATKYASAKEKMFNTDINTLSKVITNRKMAIIKLGKQEDVEMALSYYNQQKSLEIYANELQIINDKIDLAIDPITKKQKRKLEKRQLKRAYYDKRIKEINSLIDLIKQKKFDAYDEFVQEYHLKSYAKKYCNIHYNDLFVGKSKQDKNGQDKATFNIFTASVGRALPSFIALTILSMFWSSLYGNITNSAEAWFMFGSYAFAIIMGTTWGITNGKRVIEEDLSAVLTTDLEIITRILTDANCLQEIDNLIMNS